MTAPQIQPILHGLLWACATVAAALFDAPYLFTAILLPLLGFTAVYTVSRNTCG